ncbi:MAG: RagB/SusD family nutrient uptake outer membrane protein [Tannerellaceae bacterium]|nr:RagB/SusD family nutrient uptake outer membrane protein [Tannerellaceae bacterium]
MKIKTIFSILLGTATACFMPSCMDLDEDVYDKIQVDDFGKTNAEINSIIGPAYKTLREVFPSNFLYLSECTGDMAITPTRSGGDWYDGGQYRELHMHAWTSNTSVINDCWKAATESVSSCNLIYETVANSVLNDEDKEKALAEIRGVRAFWLYMLMDYWGNIPLTIDFQDTSLPTNTSRQEVYDFLVAELNEIKDLLRSDVSTTSYGKFTKGAAYTLLAKIYLNAEAWGVDSPRWQEVVDACDVVMSLGYVLEPDWKTNFQVYNETSMEAILAACFSANDTDDDTRNQLHYRTLHYKDNIALGASFEAWNGICAQADYVKLFDEEDQRLHGSFLLGEMIDPATGEIIITAHDRPLIHYVDITIIPGTEKDGTTWGEVEQEDGGRAYKWPYDKSTLDAMENDFHIFRLADVYLMKAEALVRLGANNSEATRLVNAIRERGYGNSDHNYASVTLEEVALERKLELAWECHARQDNIRFGTFQDARFLKLSTHGQDYKNIFPIPQEAWQTNQNLVQNPGYAAF